MLSGVDSSVLNGRDLLGPVRQHSAFFAPEDHKEEMAEERAVEMVREAHPYVAR